VRRGAPPLGADDDEILAELGVSADERRALREPASSVQRGAKPD
jgi:crotonobetainyl-CoA:carnitine CoA-transferase CaiB-like acyl-CoA transferase